MAKEYMSVYGHTFGPYGRTNDETITEHRQTNGNMTIKKDYDPTLNAVSIKLLPTGYPDARALNPFTILTRQYPQRRSSSRNPSPWRSPLTMPIAPPKASKSVLQVPNNPAPSLDPDPTPTPQASGAHAVPPISSTPLPLHAQVYQHGLGSRTD